MYSLHNVNSIEIDQTTPRFFILTEQSCFKFIQHLIQHTNMFILNLVYYKLRRNNKRLITYKAKLSTPNGTYFQSLPDRLSVTFGCLRKVGCHRPLRSCKNETTFQRNTAFPIKIKNFPTIMVRICCMQFAKETPKYIQRERPGHVLAPGQLS